MSDGDFPVTPPAALARTQPVRRSQRPGTLPPPGRSPRRTGTFRYQSPTYRFPDTTSPFLQKMRARALKEESLTGASVEQLEDLLFMLSQERKQLAAEHNYREGIRYNRAIDYVTRLYDQERKSVVQQAASATLKAEEKQFNEEFDSFDKNTDRMIRELADQQRERRRALQEAHQKELDDLDLRWKAPKKQRMYNRASNQVTSLRMQHAFMLTQCRFDDAQAMAQIINERTTHERNESHFIMQHDFDESLKKVQARQADELDFFNESTRLQMEKLKQDRARLRVGFENRAKKFEARDGIVSDPDKLWNRTRNQRIQANSRRRVATLPSTKMTRRDIRDSDVAILDLPPLDNRRNNASRAKK